MTCKNCEFNGCELAGKISVLNERVAELEAEKLQLRKDLVHAKLDVVEAIADHEYRGIIAELQARNAVLEKVRSAAETYIFYRPPHYWAVDSDPKKLVEALAAAEKGKE